jgi:hypothetical protein
MGVGIFASIYFLGFVLKKDYGDFRLSIEEKIYCRPGETEKRPEEEERLQTEDRIV